MSIKKLGVVGIGVFGLFLISAPAFGQYAPFYVLDGFGGVHAGGGAPTITPAPTYFGWDIAKAIDYVPIAYSSLIYGDGLIVLDGYGGVHKGGELSGIVATWTNSTYFGWNIARDIVYRHIDPLANGEVNTGDFISITDSVMHNLEGVTIYCPSDGYVLATVNAMLWQSDAGLWAGVRYGIGYGTTTTYDADTHRWAAMGGTMTGSFLPHQVACSTKLFSVTPGQHNFYFLLQRTDGTGTVKVSNSTMSLIYINKNYRGSAQVAGSEEFEKLTFRPAGPEYASQGEKR